MLPFTFLSGDNLSTYFCPEECKKGCIITLLKAAVAIGTVYMPHWVHQNRLVE